MSMQQVNRGTHLTFVYACENGHLEAAKILHGKGARITRAKKRVWAPDDDTTLMVTIERGYYDVAEWLLPLFAWSNTALKKCAGTAIKSDNIALAQKILERIPDDLINQLPESESESDIDNDEKSDNVCVVCKSKHATTLCVPCRHICMCVKCCRDSVRTHQMKKCPICDNTIAKIIRIYIS